MTSHEGGVFRFPSPIVAPRLTPYASRLTVLRFPFPVSRFPSPVAAPRLTPHASRLTTLLSRFPFPVSRPTQ